MITGLRMMKRLRKCSKQLKRVKVFLGDAVDKLSNHFLDVHAKATLKNFSCHRYSHKIFIHDGIVFNHIRSVNISIHIFKILVEDSLRVILDETLVFKKDTHKIIPKSVILSGYNLS